MKKIVILAFASLIFISCDKDFLDTEPQSTIDTEQLAKSASSNQALINGIYTALRSYGLAIGGNHEDYGHKSVLSAMDMMSNDMLMTKSSWYGSFYNYLGRQQTSVRSRLVWNTYYPQIKSANLVLSVIPSNTTDESLKAVRGQALALRGYFYFMLARTYGPTYIGNETKLCVPIYTELTLVGKARSTSEEVYTLIENDLKESIELLKEFERKNHDAVDQTVAEAFLADVYLEMGKYSEAAALAHSARESYELLNEKEWMNGFYDIKSKETMWGATITAATSTFVASFFAHFDNTNEDGYAGGMGLYKNIDKNLYNSISDSDFRKKAFVAPGGSKTYPGLPEYANIKFRDPTVTAGHYIYLRSSEMYYIEAEALARSGDEANAKKVLYEITVTRDPAYVLSTNSGSNLINEIILQKRIELWGEGCAWYDMKRLGVPLVRDYSGTNHPEFGRFNIPVGDNRFIFQMPQAEMDANPLMVQNPL
ncbi:RagB/SusD family nutrient uptake outer membrane protein [Flavobacterium sp. C3NV]|uniref:RagB/SusD family nutrient uptake outer membrane protein n=1 Tax=Flavobacterium sp. C3NV TaxID=3393358 RepID=UPI00399017D5